jgi:hypothetical protein
LRPPEAAATIRNRLHRAVLGVRGEPLEYTRRDFARLALAGVPASGLLEYDVPQGSDAVKEVQKCLAYCRAALA